MFEGLFQPMHLLVILAIAVLVFGPKKLPELGSGLAKGIRAFKDGIKLEDDAPKTPPADPAKSQPIEPK